MEIRIDQIPQEGLHLSYKLDPFRVDLGKKESLPLAEPAQVTVDLLRLESGEIYLNGLVSAKIRSECSRCLRSFPSSIETAFHLECRPDPSASFEGEPLPPQEGLDLLYYRGDQISADPEILGYLFLSVPMNPLCHSDCRGLCPGCGENLNHATCCCRAESPDFVWTGLQNFVYKETHAQSKT